MTDLVEDLHLLVNPAVAQAEARHRMHVAVVAAAVAAVLLVVLLLRLRRRDRARSAPREAPEAVALRELAAWDGLGDEARFREAVAAVSGTVRRYVEGRFGIHAPRMTTEEFFETLRTTRAIPEKFDPFWRDFMAEVDVIKYAGATPGLEQFRRLLEAARKFVAERTGAAEGAGAAAK
jgi:hypothetical protein